MRTLEGLRVVVTRATHQVEELAQPLRELGAEVILLPAIAIEPPSDPEPLRRAAAEANNYDWIIFASANAIRAFVAELPFSPAQCGARVATVGSATRRIAEEQGFSVSVVPEQYVAESLVAALGMENLDGRRVLIPSAAVTRDVVARELRGLGARVNVVEAYRNVVPAGAAERAAEIFSEPYPDWVTFASSSAVENLARLVSPDVLQRVKIASIGPITSETVRARGLRVAAEASKHTAKGLAVAICAALQ